MTTKFYLAGKFSEGKDKIEDTTTATDDISCSLDNPDDCLMCGS